VIRRLISARIPKLREETQEQLSMRSDTLAGVINRTLSFVVWIIAFMMILSVLGINVAPIIAAVGLAGLAVGFAAQNIIRDYFHGFFIIMEDWFRVGEVASLAGETGLIVDMGLRRTTLRDLNGTMHVIPNGKIELASNLARDWARINLDISVSYNENLDKVIQVINEVCQQFKDDPDWGGDMLTIPKVERVDDLGDSGIAIKILGDTKAMKQWALMGELRKRIKDRFDAEGIEIPWPHTKVYFGNAPAGK
jgi:small conductance mechanosensitive channel